jgi:glutamate/aspartate transport system substrate-binding protein
MMKKTLFLLVMLLLSAFSAAHAEDRWSAIQKRGVIKLGYRDASLPFSYLNNEQTPIGYTIDICRGIVQALEQEMGKPLQVVLVPVTSSTRMLLVANGAVDLECGSTTNTSERHRQVSFAPTTFVTATHYVAKKSSNINSLEDLKGKTVVSTAGTSNIKWASERNNCKSPAKTEENNCKPLGMNIIAAKDHAEAFLMVEMGRATAFLMDDVLLAGLVATSRSPQDWVIGSQAYTAEPYAIVEPKDDPDFKKVVDNAVIAMMKDGTIQKLYNRWFLEPIPPKQVNLQLPISGMLQKVLAQPTDSGNPDDYR